MSQQAPAIVAGIADAAQRLVPLFGQSMTFSIALQVIRPYEQQGSGTLLILALFTGIAVVLIATAQAYAHTLLHAMWLHSFEILKEAVETEHVKMLDVSFMKPMGPVSVDNKRDTFLKACDDLCNQRRPYPGTAVPAASRWYTMKLDLARVAPKHEAFAILAPAVVLLTKAMRAGETVMVNFASVVMGTLIVQEASDLAQTPAAWTLLYAVFGFAFASVLQEAEMRAV